MKHLLKHLAWLDGQQSEMLELVVELCDINSGTFNLEGLKRVEGRLIEEFAILKGETTVLPTSSYLIVDDNGKEVDRPLGNMIVIRKRPNAKKRVLLCIHMDTVYPVDHPFQKCEALANGNVCGPGVADAKGGLVVMLYALQAFEHRLSDEKTGSETIGWDVLINPDEEIGSPGSYQTINELAAQNNFGMLFEPSLPDGTLVSWRKGSGNFVFVVRGQSAHAGREFENGRNAIVAMSNLMLKINGLNTDPEVTFNVGHVSGGGPLNVVPDLAIGRVNVRVKTVEQQSIVEEQFLKLVAQCHDLDGFTCEMSGKFSSPPKPLSQEVKHIQSNIEKCGEALGMEINWRGTGGACDGNKFAAAGLPNIDTLGPCGGNIHSPTEFLIPDSLVPRAKLAALMLLAFADAT